MSNTWWAVAAGRRKALERRQSAEAGGSWLHWWVGSEACVYREGLFREATD